MKHQENICLIIKTTFMLADPKSARKTVKLSVFIALLGSWCTKAAHRTLMKLTPVDVVVVGDRTPADSPNSHFEKEYKKVFKKRTFQRKFFLPFTQAALVIRGGYIPQIIREYQNRG